MGREGRLPPRRAPDSTPKKPNRPRRAALRGHAPPAGRGCSPGEEKLFSRSGEQLLRVERTASPDGGVRRGESPGCISCGTHLQPRRSAGATSQTSTYRFCRARTSAKTTPPATIASAMGAAHQSAAPQNKVGNARIRQPGRTSPRARETANDVRGRRIA